MSGPGNAINDYTDRTVVQLKLELRNRKLVSTGKKADLIDRILLDDLDDEQPLLPPTAKRKRPALVEINENTNVETNTDRNVDQEHQQYEEYMAERERELIHRERYLIDRERELIEREEALQQKENNFTQSSNTPTARPFSLRDISDVLPEFDPENHSKVHSFQFVERVTRLREAYKWEESMLVLAAQSKLRGNAKIWSDTQVVVYRRWADFSAELLLHFPKQQHEADAHIAMVNAARNANEAITSYYHRMCAIGRRGGVSEVATIKYIQNGLRFTSLQNTIAGMTFQNCLELYSFLSRFEENHPATKSFVPLHLNGPLVRHLCRNTSRFEVNLRNHKRNVIIATNLDIYQSIVQSHKDVLDVQNASVRVTLNENVVMASLYVQ